MIALGIPLWLLVFASLAVFVVIALVVILVVVISTTKRK